LLYVGLRDASPAWTTLGLVSAVLLTYGAVASARRKVVADNIGLSLDPPTSRGSEATAA
jgi:hypothetical protein